MKQPCWQFDDDDVGDDNHNDDDDDLGEEQYPCGKGSPVEVVVGIATPPTWRSRWLSWWWWQKCTWQGQGRDWGRWRGWGRRRRQWSWGWSWSWSLRYTKKKKIVRPCICWSIKNTGILVQFLYRFQWKDANHFQKNNHLHKCFKCFGIELMMMV